MTEPIDESEPRQVLKANFWRAYSRLFLCGAVMLAFAAALQGKEWNQSYWLALIAIVFLFPLLVWVMFVPHAIEWSDTHCVVRTRFHGPLAFAWEQLVGFGNGRGCFLLQFQGARQFAIHSGAFDRARWKEFTAFLRHAYPKKECRGWVRPQGFR